MIIKLVVCGLNLNTISVYMPQVSLDEKAKKLCWKDLDKKLVCGLDLNAISVYVTQVSLDEEAKLFCKDLDKVVRSIPNSEKIFIGMVAWSSSEDVNNIWVKIANCIREADTDVLRVSKGMVDTKEIGGGMEKSKVKWKQRRLHVQSWRSVCMRKRSGHLRKSIR